MSNADRNEATSVHSEAAQCGADGLKGLLQRIAEQIADTDRRHSETLHQMKDRLGSLGDEARSMRRRVPTEFAPAFARIEEGMTLLAERISGYGSVAQRGQPWATAPAVGSSAQAVVAPEQHQAAATLPVGGSTVAGGQPQDAASAAAEFAETFDALDRPAPDATSDWSAADADALVRVYESSEAGLSRTTPQAGDVEAGTGAAIEREWLEERLADIAQRVERSMKELHADTSITTLGQRFDQFEQRFNAAMDGVATRADVDGLRLIEAQINEIATHLDRTQAQLQRLDGIEGQLHSVVDSLSNERFAALIEQGTPDLERIAATAAEQAVAQFAQMGNGGAGPDIERLADLAAERAAVQVAGLNGGRGNDEHHLEDLRGLLEGFITERRQGEEQTATMLDTMQQAMIRVLDRIDAIEMANTRAPVQAVMSMAPAAPREDQHFALDPELKVDPSRGGAGVMIDAAQVPRVTRTGGVSTDPPEIMHDQHSHSAPEPRPAMRSKDDFIAAARRAARQAANEPAMPDVAHKGKPHGGSGEPSNGAPSRSVASMFGLGRKTVMATLLAVIVSMSGTLLFLQRHSDAQTAAAVTATTTDSASRAATRDQASAAHRLLNPDAGSADRDTAALSQDRHNDEADTPARSGNGNVALDSDTGATDVAAPAGGAARATTQVGVIPGISLQPSKATVRDLEHLREQQEIAAMSSRLGAAAAKATPASLQASSAFADEAGDPEAAGQPAQAEASQAQKALALPPATVGPTSLRVAAAKGDPSAQFEVGARLAQGKGTNQDFAGALQWYQRAAQQGFAQAQYRVATFYERGLGAKLDLGRAVVWYKRAAELGNVKAMHNLAVLSASSKSGAPDYATAAKWFTEAAERGLVDSQFNLAVLHESGLGVAKDMRQAYKWMTIAARAGDAETVKRRERMRTALSQTDFEAAEALIRDWQPTPADPVANDAHAAGQAWMQRTGGDGNG
jgi:localization factor PodJL